jgi:hypothetical protein
MQFLVNADEVAKKVFDHVDEFFEGNSMKDKVGDLFYYQIALVDVRF